MSKYWQRSINGVIAALLLGTSIASVTLRPHGSPVAAWWPAAGLAVWLMVRQESARTRALAALTILCLTGAANMAVDRPIWLCLIFGALNTTEAVLSSALLRRGGRSPSLRRISDFGNLIVASTVGAAVIAISVALVAPPVLGGFWWLVLLSVFPSHLSGQLLVMSVVLTRFEPRARGTWHRPLLMLLALGATFGGVFLGTRGEPLAFLPMAVMVAAAFVLRPRGTATMALLLAALVVFASAWGRGPFNGDLPVSPAAAAALVQAYLICLIGLATPLSLAIGERNSTLAEIERHNRRLIDYDRLKSDFLNAVTHELRTPLTTILGYSDVLARGQLGDLSDQQRNSAVAVHRNGQRLLDLVNQLIDAASLSSDHGTGPLELIDAPALLKKLAGSALCRDRTVLLTGLGATDSFGTVVLEGEPDRLRQALEHVLRNAIQATDIDGRITADIAIEENPSGQNMVLTISDDGHGIEPCDLERILEPFQRTTRSTRDAVRGVGLGLSLAARIIAEHRGDLTLASTVGEGTTVTITLPLTTRQRGAVDEDQLALVRL